MWALPGDSDGLNIIIQTSLATVAFNSRFKSSIFNIIFIHVPICSGYPNPHRFIGTRRSPTQHTPTLCQRISLSTPSRKAAPFKEESVCYGANNLKSLSSLLAPLRLHALNKLGLSCDEKHIQIKPPFGNESDGFLGG